MTEIISFLCIHTFCWLHWPCLHAKYLYYRLSGLSRRVPFSKLCQLFQQMFVWQKCSDSQQDGSVWLLPRCTSHDSTGWTPWHRFFCNFGSSVSIGETMQGTLGWVSIKKTSLYHFTKGPAYAHSEAYLHLHPHFLLQLSRTYHILHILLWDLHVSFQNRKW